MHGFRGGAVSNGRGTSGEAATRDPGLDMEIFGFRQNNVPKVHRILDSRCGKSLMQLLQRKPDYRSDLLNPGPPTSRVPARALVKNIATQETLRRVSTNFLYDEAPLHLYDEVPLLIKSLSL